MKTIKTLITLLLMTIGMAAQAQTVVIEKTDGTSDSYNLADVDSVVYEPKAEVKYYYYAGWTCPTNEEELANNGIQITNYETLKSGDVIYDYTTNPIKYTSNSIYYLVVPNDSKLTIIDSLGDNAWYIFDEYNTISIPGYKAYVAKVSSRNINGFILKVK